MRCLQRLAATSLKDGRRNPQAMLELASGKKAFVRPAERALISSGFDALPHGSSVPIVANVFFRGGHGGWLGFSYIIYFFEGFVLQKCPGGSKLILNSPLRRKTSLLLATRCQKNYMVQLE